MAGARSGGTLHERVIDLFATDGPPERSRWAEVTIALEILQTFVFATIGMLLLWAVVPGLLPGWQSAAIVSGSMAPAVEVGDVVVFRPASAADLGVDAVVRFPAAEPDGSAGTITHRIVDIAADGTITTRGDANGRPDSRTLTAADIDGLGVLVVPLVGQPLVWADADRPMPLLGLSLAIGSMLLPAVLRHRIGQQPAVERRAVGPLIAGRLPTIGSGS
ncbi:MAG: signal peptidase I [Acidimicrobiales bacterium]